MEMLAAIIFVLMYVLIVSEKVHRTIVAMMGAILMIIVGIMPVDTALHPTDSHTPRPPTGPRCPPDWPEP